MGDKDPGETVEPTTTLDELDPGAYELLLLPGGTINADQLRLQSKALETVKAFASSGRPIAAICHGPWALVEADVLNGKTLTSFASVRTDIRNSRREGMGGRGGRERQRERLHPGHLPDAEGPRRVRRRRQQGTGKLLSQATLHGARTLRRQPDLSPAAPA